MCVTWPYFDFLGDYLVVAARYLVVTALNFLLYRGLVVITAAHLPSTKSELRFCASSKPARGVSEICDGQNL